MKTFLLTEEQKLLQDLARDLARAEIRPRSEMVDHGSVYPLEGMNVLAEAGLLACTVPETYGGAALDCWSQISVIEEVARECASTAWTVAASAEMGECLLNHGTPQQRELVLPALIAGSLAVAVDEAALRAKRTAAGYLLNGVIRHVPLAGACTWYLVPAIDEDTPRWFLIENRAPGLHAEPGPRMLGMKGCSMGELVLVNCEVSADRLVEGDIMPTLTAAQALDMAAIAAGVARGALEETITYVNQRVQFGKTIAQFENTQQVIAELLAKTESARALVWAAARVKDSGEEYAYLAAMAKLVASDTACIVTRKCVQFMGGYGYSREYPVERRMRDAKMTEVCAGSSKVQKDKIARAAVLRNI